MMICFVLDLLLIRDYKNTRCSDVRIAVDHLKSGKGDGFEGLCSDHFINGTKKVICVFYLLYSLYF